MCRCLATPPPEVALEQLAAKIALLGDLFSLPPDESPPALSKNGVFGLVIYLRELEDEIMDISEEVSKLEEVRS